MVRLNVRKANREDLNWLKRQLKLNDANFDAEMEENGGEVRRFVYYNIPVGWEVDMTGSQRVPSA